MLNLPREWQRIMKRKMNSVYLIQKSITQEYGYFGKTFCLSEDIFTKLSCSFMTDFFVSGDHCFIFCIFVGSHLWVLTVHR